MKDWIYLLIPIGLVGLRMLFEVRAERRRRLKALSRVTELLNTLSFEEFAGKTGTSVIGGRDYDSEC